MMTQWDRASLGTVLAHARPDLFGGILINAFYGPVLDAWKDQFATLKAPLQAPLPIPATVSVDRLYKSLDVSRSLGAAKAKYQSGLLDDARGRMVFVNGVERLRPGVSTALALHLDQQRRHSNAMALVAFDNTHDATSHIPSMLAEQLAFRADLRTERWQEIGGVVFSEDDVLRTRTHMKDCNVSEDTVAAISLACLQLGVGSMRVPIYCAHAASALAALNGRKTVKPDDLTQACELVLTGRGTSVADSPPTEQSREQEDHKTSNDDHPPAAQKDEPETVDALAEQIVHAVASAPVHLDPIAKRGIDRGRAGISGQTGGYVRASDRGRPDRSKRTQLGSGRIDILATLRTAAPWQTARANPTKGSGFKIMKADLRLKQFKRRKQSSVIFVVDASGSAAANRLAEAKGAIERLLSQCYARRDLVSLVSFSGTQARLLLPPSRSLVRARRQISELAGGGSTPLAHAVAEAFRVAQAEKERGRTPFLVFLTDGSGNVSLERAADRQTARDQTARLARTLINGRFSSVIFDTSRRPDPRTRQLGEDLGAQYQFLPNSDGDTVSRLVRQRIGSH
ncbi:MAG: VWA domain-containing protein [Pseudomonadota bacterium]